MEYNHIIWDFDGTLFDTYPAMAAAFSAALAEYGIIEATASIGSHLMQSAGHATQHYKERYHLGDDFSARYKVLQRETEQICARPFDGAVELCSRISVLGGKQYLFTHRGDSARALLEKYELAGYFTELVTAKQGFARKPRPDALLYLMERHHFSRDQALMIGDRMIDILAAKNAGIASCYIANGGVAFETADWNLNGLADLFPLLTSQYE